MTETTGIRMGILMGLMGVAAITDLRKGDVEKLFMLLLYIQGGRHRCWTGKLSDKYRLD